MLPCRGPWRSPQGRARRGELLPGRLRSNSKGPPQRDPRRYPRGPPMQGPWSLPVPLMAASFNPNSQCPNGVSGPTGRPSGSTWSGTIAMRASFGTSKPALSSARPSRRRKRRSGKAGCGRWMEMRRLPRGTTPSSACGTRRWTPSCSWRESMCVCSLMERMRPRWRRSRTPGRFSRRCTATSCPSGTGLCAWREQAWGPLASPAWPPPSWGTLTLLASCACGPSPPSTAATPARLARWTGCRT
eukprot:jgi/Botrbrau1/18797/Bobra.0887s0001.2